MRHQDRRTHLRVSLCIPFLLGAALPGSSSPAQGSTLPPNEFPTLAVRPGGAGGGEHLGFSLAGISSTAGESDFNGDGFMDYVAGSPFWNQSTVDDELCHTGKITLVLGGFDVGATQIVIVNPELQAGALFGFAVSGAFDVNGDMYADLIVGVPGADVPDGAGGFLRDAGKAWIIPGRPDALLGTVGNPATWFELRGDDATGLGVAQAGAMFGYSVSYIGTDAGSFDDVLVGAPFQDFLGLVDAGQVYAFGAAAAGASWVAPNNGQVLRAPNPQAGALFGHSVSGAGLFSPAAPPAFDDTDIVIGEPFRDTTTEGADAGAAYVFARGPAPGAMAYTLHATLVRLDAAPNSLFGFSVADIGEFSGTFPSILGRDDVIIGAPGAAQSLPNDGAAYVYAGESLLVFGQDPTAPLGSPPVALLLPFLTLPGEAGMGSRFGWAVSGGVNMDSVFPEGTVPPPPASDEAIVGAPGYGPDQRGATYLFLGEETHPRGTGDASPDCVLLGSALGLSSGARLGWAVSEAYNVDCWVGQCAGTDRNRVYDEEMLVAAPFEDAADPNGGYYLLLDWDKDAPSPDCAITLERRGTSTGERLGFALARGGDWTGDGIDDVVVGAPFFDYEPEPVGNTLLPPYVCNRGRAYVLDGDSGEAAFVLEDAQATSDARFGWSIAVGNFSHALPAAPDVEDIVVGLPGAAVFGTRSGQAVLFDGATMVSTGPAIGLRRDGPAFSAFGSEVARGGELDGDTSFEEFLVGAPFPVSSTAAGFVQRFRGNAVPAAITPLFPNIVDPAWNGTPTEFGRRILALGDLDGGGRTEIAVGVPLQPGAGTLGRVCVYRGENPIGAPPTLMRTIDRAGEFGRSLAVVGDQNNDGFSDLAVGAPRDGADRGRVYVFSLKPALPVLGTFVGEADGDRFGTALADYPSIDGIDALPDLVVGAPFASNARGRVYFFRSTGPLLHRITGQTGGERFGSTVMRAGFLQSPNDGVEDCVVGSPDFDSFAGIDAGKVTFLDVQ